MEIASDELLILVRQIDPTFDATEYLKSIESEFTIGNLVKSKKLTINAFTSSDKKHLTPVYVYGALLPENLNDVTWQLVAKEVGYRHSVQRYFVELDIKESRYQRGKKDYCYSVNLLPLKSKEELESALGDVVKATEELTGKINKEMERLKGL
jgi:hypothetical protein